MAMQEQNLSLTQSGGACPLWNAIATTFHESFDSRTPLRESIIAVRFCLRGHREYETTSMALLKWKTYKRDLRRPFSWLLTSIPEPQSHTMLFNSMPPWGIFRAHTRALVRRSHLIERALAFSRSVLTGRNPEDHH